MKRRQLQTSNSKRQKHVRRAAGFWSLELTRFTVCRRAESLQRRGDVGRSESLTCEEVIEACAFLFGADVPAAAKFFPERSVDQRGFIEITEDLGDSCGCNVARDPHRVELARDPKTSASLDRRRRPRVRARHATIVQRAALGQLRDGGVSVLWFVLAVEEPLAQLRRRQFPSRQQPQGVGVGGQISRQSSVGSRQSESSVVSRSHQWQSAVHSRQSTVAVVVGHSQTDDSDCRL